MLALTLLLAASQAGPVLPVGIAPHLTRLSLSIQRSLEAGDFDAARRGLREWPSGKLTYQAEGMPATYANALKIAADMVAEASDGLVTFEAGSGPKVVFRFVPMPDAGPPEPAWKDGKAVMDVPITDRGGAEANERSVAWSFAKGMSYAAGLDYSTRRRSVMGPVAYTRSLSPARFSVAEQTLFSEIGKVRTALQKAVDERTKLTPAVPRIQVEPDVVDMKTVIRGDHYEFSLTIKNIGNATAKIEIETTCSCLVATHDLSVEPGQSVTVKPKFDSADYQGSIEKHLYVLSNSPEEPRATVVLKTLVAPETRFLPPRGATEVRSAGVGADLVEVVIPDTGEARPELTFYGTKEPINLLDVQLGSPLASAMVVPFEGIVDDPLFGKAIRQGSRVTLALPESWPFGISWLRIVGVTDSKRKPIAEMTLQIRKGIAASPQSAYFGDAAVGVQSERIVMIDHPSKAFKILKVVADEGLSAAISPVGSDGKRYQLVIRTTPKAAGTISGSVRLSTDSAAQPTITVPVGGVAK